MKNFIFLFAIGSLLMLGNKTYSQSTDGTLTFTFTQAVPSGTSATKNVMAIWIEDNAGTFIKTKMRFWGNNTTDHLPSWVTKSTQNITDATTGATRLSSTNPTAFGAKTIIWDGKGAVSGTIVADGTYKVWIESSYCNPQPAGGQHWLITSFSFTKGATTYHSTPTGDANFSGITIDWVPSTSGIENLTLGSNFNIFPNPSNRFINIDLSQVPAESKIQIYSIIGKKLYEENVEQSSGAKAIDMNSFENGVYLINIQYKNQNKAFKVLLNK